jgi:hypothetical protein
LSTEFGIVSDWNVQWMRDSTMVYLECSIILCHKGRWSCFVGVVEVMNSILDIVDDHIQVLLAFCLTSCTLSCNDKYKSDSYESDWWLKVKEWLIM